MSTDHTPEYVTGLITELCKLPGETGWLEFKVDNSNPEDIGEYISALSNTAALRAKAILFDGYLMGGPVRGQWRGPSIPKSSSCNSLRGEQ